MIRKASLIAAAALFAVAIVATLGALWWWALRGMSQDVGTAWVFTIPLLAIAGCLLMAYGMLCGDEQ